MWPTHEPTHDPTHDPTPQPIYNNNNYFEVSSGSCTSDGSCIYSPNYPLNYGNDQSCTFDVCISNVLDVVFFSTEENHDILKVGGIDYSGSNDPNGVSVSKGSTMSWYSDGSRTNKGFKICSSSNYSTKSDDGAAIALGITIPLLLISLLVYFCVYRSSAGQRRQRPSTGLELRQVAQNTGRSKMQVTVPRGAGPGTKLQLQAPGGSMFTFTVPASARAGSVLKVPVPISAAHAPSPPDTRQVAQPAQIKMRVTVPPGAGPGTTLQLQVPGGGTFTFCVPAGAVPGTLLEVSVPSSALQRHRTRFVITVPPGAHPGSIINLQTPNGAMLFKVPAGGTPGSRLEVAIPQRHQQPAQERVPNRYSFGPGTLLAEAEAAGKSPHAGNPQADIESLKSARELFDEKDYPNGEGDLVKACLNTGLDFHELTLVVWKKEGTVFRCDMANIGPQLFELIDSDSTGYLTTDDLIAAMGEKSLIEHVRGIKCPVLMKLFDEKESYMRKAFEKLDTDGSGTIDEEEWMAFLRQVQADRLLYYKKKFLLKNHVYSGKGIEPGHPYFVWAVQNGYLVRGFWMDLKFYTFNNHPLFQMFYGT